MLDKDIKLTYITFFVAFSFAVTMSQISGRLFPWISISLLVLLVIFIYSLRGGTSTNPQNYLIAIILMSVTFRVYIFTFPESLIGVDADTNAYWAHLITESGSYSSIQSAFYADIPIYYVFLAQLSLITGEFTTHSLISYSILLGVLLPIVSYHFTSSISNSNQVIVMAALVASITTIGVRYSYQPAAQTHSVLLVFITYVLLVNYVRTMSVEDISIITLLLITLAYTHKIPLAILVGIIFVFSIIYIYYALQRSSRYSHILLLMASSISVLLLQWMYISEQMLSDFVRRTSVLFTILTGGNIGSPSSSVITNDASRVRPGITGDLFNYPVELAFYIEFYHIITLLIFGGVGWILMLFIIRPSLEKILILSTTASCVGVVFLSFFSTDIIPGPHRALIFIEPLLSSLIVISTFTLLEKYNKIGLNIFHIFIIILLSTQILAAASLPDYHNTPRYYLDTSEVQGKMFAHSYVDGEVHADWHYTQERYFGGAYIDNFSPLDREESPSLFNGNITDQNYKNIMLRTNVEVYTAENTRLKLDWDPVEGLNSEYSKTYDSNTINGYAHV